MEDGATYSQLVEGALINLIYSFLNNLLLLFLIKEMFELKTVLQRPIRNLTLQKLVLIFEIVLQVTHLVGSHY